MISWFKFHFIPNGETTLNRVKCVPYKDGHILKQLPTIEAYYSRFMLTEKPIMDIHIGRGSAQIRYRWFGFLQVIYHK